MNPAKDPHHTREDASSLASRRPFECVDMSAADRKGGRGSGLSRRLKPQRMLEEKILESRNGHAQLELLRLKLQQEAELQRERIRLDDLVCQLEDEADQERATIERLREQRRLYEAAASERMAAPDSEARVLEQQAAGLREVCE